MSLAGILARKGASVVCTKTVPGLYDATTDTWSPPTTLAVAGHAMQIEGNPDLYTALSLIESDNPTLLFRPDVAGTLPTLGFSIPWGGETLIIKHVAPLAMNGTRTAAHLVVSR